MNPLLHRRLSVLPSVALVVALLTSLAGIGKIAAQDEDAEWPLEIQSGDSRILLYQPQPESLQNDRLTARAAVSVEKKGDAEPSFGAVWIDARVATDRDARTVTVLDIQVPDVRFPNASDAMKESLAQTLRTELPRLRHTFSLDRLMTTLDAASGQNGEPAVLDNTPPKILLRTEPAVLVTVDGPPQMEAIEGSRVLRVVNTPFIVLFDGATKTYHVKAGEAWEQSRDLVGPYAVEPNPPPEVASAVPPAQAGGSAPAAGAPPQLVVSTEPTELIACDGAPKWTPLEGNDLLYLANTPSDVFLDVASQDVYVLLSGRWFRSAALEGKPWAFVAPNALPAAFSRIAPGSAKASVRAFVAGTEEARDAVLDASIPQTSVIQRSDAKCSTVYDGEPQFAPVEGTHLRYAVNTPASVVEFGGQYYCCNDGVWFVATSAVGPWSVCASVPPEIYSIPPSCPIYPVRYVYVYGATPETVYVGYLPGYTGCFLAGPTVVYGTGWWYHGWWHHAYYPRPCTWGFHAHYDPWTCGWSFGFETGWGSGSNWFAISVGWGHPGWWGAGGFHGARFDIQGSFVRAHPLLAPAAGRFQLASHAGHYNIYGRPENTPRNFAVREKNAVAPRARVAGRTPNDLYADRNGNVLRRTESGWEEHGSAGWKPAERPAEPAAPKSEAGRERPAPASSRLGRAEPTPKPSPREELERVHQARVRGATRASAARPSRPEGPGSRKG